MSAVWPYVAAIVPTILVATLFYFLIKCMMEGDRRERLAQSSFEGEEDRHRARGRSPEPIAPPHRPTTPGRRTDGPAQFDDGFLNLYSPFTFARTFPLLSSFPTSPCRCPGLPGESPLKGKPMAKKVQVLLVDDVDKSSPLTRPSRSPSTASATRST